MQVNLPEKHVGMDLSDRVSLSFDITYKVEGFFLYGTESDTSPMILFYGD